MSALSGHYPTGCWVQPNGEYAGECTCGHTFVGASYELAKTTWAKHASSPDAEMPDSCPLCSGDCGSANPPVIFCPMRATSSPDAAGSGGEAREANLRPMAEAPKDGSYIVGYYQSIANELNDHWNGRAFVIRHEGNTVSDFDLGWGLFPGYGGVPDICFAG